MIGILRYDSHKGIFNFNFSVHFRLGQSGEQVTEYILQIEKGWEMVGIESWWGKKDLTTPWGCQCAIIIKCANYRVLVNGDQGSPSVACSMGHPVYTLHK